MLFSEEQIDIPPELGTILKLLTKEAIRNYEILDFNTEEDNKNGRDGLFMNKWCANFFAKMNSNELPYPKITKVDEHNSTGSNGINIHLAENQNTNKELFWNAFNLYTMKLDDFQNKTIPLDRLKFLLKELSQYTHILLPENTYTEIVSNLEIDLDHRISIKALETLLHEIVDNLII